MRIALLTFVVISVATAHAETMVDRAKRLFEEGLALEDRGEDGACDRFAESYKLVAAAGTGFNLAECMERSGQLLRAWRLYRAAAKQWDRDDKDKRADIARDRASALETKLVTIVVKLRDPSLKRLTVTIGDRRVDPEKTIRDVVDPGEIEVTAAAPGHEPFAKRVGAEAGATVTVPIALEPIVEQPPPIVETHRRRSRVALAITLGALGVGAGAAGGFLFLDAGKKVDAGDREGGVRQADRATIAGVAAGALVLSAVIVFYTAPRDVTVAPIVSGDGGGISLGGRF